MPWPDPIWISTGLDDAKYVTFDAAVPEPGSLAVFGLGLLGLGYMRRRKMA